MGAPCFPQPNLWLARCASMSWTALKKFVVLSIQRLRVGKTWKEEKPFIPLRAESVAGFVGAPSAPSVASCCVCSVLHRLAPSCAVLCRLAPSSAVLRRLAPSCRLRRRARWPVARLPSATIESLNLGISWLRPLASS